MCGLKLGSPHSSPPERSEPALRGSQEREQIVTDARGSFTFLWRMHNRGGLACGCLQKDNRGFLFIATLSTCRLQGQGWPLGEWGGGRAESISCTSHRAPPTVPAARALATGPHRVLAR